MATAEGPLADGQGNSQKNGDVHPRYGQDVGGASPSEVLHYVIGQVVSNPQEQGLAQRGLGLRHRQGQRVRDASARVVKPAI